MGKVRDEESEGLDDLVIHPCNIMHGFLFRFGTALVTTFIWGVAGAWMSVHGVTLNMLWATGTAVIVSIIAWIGSARQLYLDTLYNQNDISLEETMLGRDMPW